MFHDYHDSNLYGLISNSTSQGTKCMGKPYHLQISKNTGFGVKQECQEKVGANQTFTFRNHVHGSVLH